MDRMHGYVTWEEVDRMHGYVMIWHGMFLGPSDPRRSVERKPHNWEPNVSRKRGRDAPEKIRDSSPLTAGR